MDTAKEATGNLGSYAYSPAKAGGERSIGEILKDTISNVQDIVRSEVRLAKIEAKQEIAKVVSASAMFGAAAVVGLLGLAFCFLCAVYALALVLPAWAAALIVGVVLLLTALVLLSTARAQLRKVKMPEKTMFTVKEDVEWMRSQNKS